MGSPVLIYRQEIPEDVDPTFRARVCREDGTPLDYTTDIDGTIILNVYDLGPGESDPDAPLHTESAIVASSCMFATLQQSGWNKDEDGYNFKRLESATNFTMEGNHTYRWEYQFPLSAALGSGFAWALFETPVVPVVSA